MRQVRLAPDLTTSALGLGCMGMSEYYGPIDDRTSTAVIHRALDAGVRLFDSADVYGPYSNEALLGRALAGAPDDVVIATKFGQVRTATGERLGTNGRPEYVRRSCELSLQRLGVDQIGLYYQHRIDPSTPIEETVGAMADLVSEGKVARIGLCEASVDTIRRAHAVHPISVVQTEYSMFSRDVEETVLPELRARDIGLVAYSPLGRGLLASVPLTRDQFTTDDLRRRPERQPRFSEENHAANLALANEIALVAEGIGCTLAQLALAWLMSKPGVVPIPGTKHLDRLNDNLGAIDIELDDTTLALLGSRFAPGRVKGTRYGDMSTVGGATVAQRS